uniref:Uncharacterized protein n=2 Tax=Aegilops tauschii subsp. strangulata TaxID=200361 RepID=A0A453SEB4_AEGTS
VLTYLAWKISEFPGCRVIGSDTNLHSSKSRFLIAEHLDINVQDVQEPPLHCLLFFALLFSVDHEVHICRSDWKWRQRRTEGDEVKTISSDRSVYYTKVAPF